MTDRFIKKAHPRRLQFRRKYGQGIDFMEQDWDYLLILDACRYDIFSEVADIDGELDFVISKGSHSREFCEHNFEHRNYHDTIYVTANGYGARSGEGTFHDLIFTDRMDSIAEVDVLHSTKKGLAPSTVYNAASDAAEKYPNKRMIVHFMQPHMPYLGNKAEALRDRVENEGLIVKSRDEKKIEKYSDVENAVSGLDGAFRKGYISEEELQEVYVENLEIVLGFVDKLLTELDGKMVVTSDHGEYLGEYGKAGHYEYEYTPELRKVPWLVVNKGKRPKIIEEKPSETTSIDQDLIEKRLRSLGYKD